MKYRFIDFRNFHTLTPPIGKFPLTRYLDEYLQQINDDPGSSHGLIDALVRQNIKTNNLSCGSARLCKSPIKITQAASITDPRCKMSAYNTPLPSHALLHTVQIYESGLVWKTMVPLQILLKGWGDANKGHQGYVHAISQNMNQIHDPFNPKELKAADKDSYYYVGITGRNWLTRLQEHIGEIRRGSRKTFHNAWRENLSMTNVLYSSTLFEVNLTYDDAMNWEERKVDQIASDTQGLNMIPGGFKGLRELHKLGITSKEKISLDERETAIAEYIRRYPRKGIPHPLMADHWQEYEFYLNYIESRSNTLSADQVRKIRELYSLGKSVPEIAEEVDALNELQVKRVIKGITYKRVQE